MFYDFIIKYTDIFVEKIEELSHGKSFSHFFNKKCWRILVILKVNKQHIVSFEQLGPEIHVFPFVKLTETMEFGKSV